MISNMGSNSTNSDVNQLKQKLADTDIAPQYTNVNIRTTIGFSSSHTETGHSETQSLPNAEDVIKATEPYKNTSRDFNIRNSIINVSGVLFGG